jgi:hypothetical protein
MMYAKFFLGLVVFWLTFGTSIAGAEWHVWTVTETRRVLREDPAGESLAVRLSAARGEWESFQILMRSDQPVAGIDLHSADLVGPDGTVWRADHARRYRQHQLHLSDSTYRNQDFRPGWYPDALIPFRDPGSGASVSRPVDSPSGDSPERTGSIEPRFVAVPFDLPADQTHGFWIDLYVPPGTTAGEYRGTWRLTATDGQAVEIPVALEVWDFDLPRVSTLVTALGSPAERMRSYYRQRAQAGKEPEPEDWAAVDEQCARLLTEHRINATPPGPLAPVAGDDGCFHIPEEQISALRSFVDQYHVNAVAIPHPRAAVQDPETERDRLHAWLNAWDEAAARLDRPQIVFYIYLKDEPNDEEAYQYVQRWGRAIRNRGKPGQAPGVHVLVVEQTWTQNPAWGDLYGAVDIWCPLFSLHRPESAAARQALGETIWTYTALCQGKPTPWWHTDYPLLNYRAPAWIAWRYRITGILYWGGMSYWRGVDDPWTDPKTLDRRVDGRGALFNGEGSLLYPGRAVGYEGIAPSLRLKALRDAIEDYEYLAILQRAGRAEQAESIVAAVAASWYDWQRDPAAYQRAREQLAKLIVASQ